MDVPLWLWAVTVALILLMILVDYLGHVRSAHEPSLKESAWWTAAYVAVAVGFGLLVWGRWGPVFAEEYFAGYITEKSLSVDNLFVFVLIMSSFAVPRAYQQKVLLIGITVALVLRTIFIAVGVTLIENYTWIFFVFGAFLLYTAWNQIRHRSKSEEEFSESLALRVTRRLLPVTDDYVADHLTVKRNGKRMITPMMVVLIAIGTADVIFAVDSIPAIFGLTQEAFLVFAANAFSLLGLRQLFFLVDGLLDRLVYLSYGLGAVLALIGIKLVIHALHTNELPFINSGQHVETIPEIPTMVSLGAIALILTVTTVASLSMRRPQPDQVQKGTGN